MDKSAKDIYKLIKRYDVITIYGHINPDCDSYGSTLGLRELIKDNFNNKQVYALGYGQDDLYNRLAKHDIVSDDIIKNSLAIVLDCSELSRVRDSRVSNAKQICKIDHHIESTPFDYPKWVDVSSIATCQMIAEFGFAYHLKFSKLTAELLYLGICTDSGRFRYHPTNAKTHQIVAKLYKYNIEPKTIFDILYQSDERMVKYQARLISKFQKTKNNVIYCFADKEDYEQFGLTFDEVSKNVNVLGNIKGCPIWVLFTRDPNKNIRCEFRSAGLDIHQVATKYGGGGHKCASGAKLVNCEWDLPMQIVEDLDKVVSGDFH